MRPSVHKMSANKNLQVRVRQWQGQRIRIHCTLTARCCSCVQLRYERGQLHTRIKFPSRRISTESHYSGQRKPSITQGYIYMGTETKPDISKKRKLRKVAGWETVGKRKVFGSGHKTVHSTHRNEAGGPTRSRTSNTATEKMGLRCDVAGHVMIRRSLWPPQRTEEDGMSKLCYMLALLIRLRVIFSSQTINTTRCMRSHHRPTPTALSLNTVPHFPPSPLHCLRHESPSGLRGSRMDGIPNSRRPASTV
jgi:hypothetical protein